MKLIMENWRQYLDEETTDSSQNQEIMIEIHKLIKNQCTILTEDARGTLYFESVQRGLEKLVSRYGKKALSAAVAATLGLASPVAAHDPVEPDPPAEQWVSPNADARYGWEPDGARRANYNMVNDQFDHGIIKASELLKWYKDEISFIDAAAADYNELLEAGMPPSEASERLMGPLGPKRPQAWSANVPKWSGFIDWNGIPPHVKTNNKPLREVYSTELGDLQSVMDRLGDFKRDGDLGADVGVVVP